MTGIVVWFTGLPSSGKTTLARAVQEKLSDGRRAVCLLDSDEVRPVLTPGLSYTCTDRETFYNSLAELAALLARQGLVVLVAATAHRIEHRDRARRTSPRFIEVYVRTAVEECERRDPKNLYARARRGEITSLPGVQVEYQPPANPDVIAQGGMSEDAVDEIVRRLNEAVL